MEGMSLKASFFNQPLLSTGTKADLERWKNHRQAIVAFRAVVRGEHVRAGWDESGVARGPVALVLTWRELVGKSMLLFDWSVGWWIESRS